MSVMTNDYRRLFVAFAVAPLVPALALLVASIAVNPLEGIWGAAMIAPVSYITAICPGSLLYFVLRRHGLVSASACMLVGTLCGAITTPFFMWNSMMQAWAVGAEGNWAPSVTFAVIAAVLGSISGYVFWVISRARPAN